MEHPDFDRTARRYVEDEDGAEAVSPLGRIAEMVKTLRKDRGWSAEKLAQLMTAAGVPWERMVVTKLELGKRQTITVEEWLALSYVLEISPVHLLVPYEADDIPYRAIPAGRPYSSAEMRRWVAGEDTLEGVDIIRVASHVPEDQKGPDRRGMIRSLQAEALLASFDRDPEVFVNHIASARKEDIVRLGRQIREDQEADDAR